MKIQKQVIEKIVTIEEKSPAEIAFEGCEYAFFNDIFGFADYEGHDWDTPEEFMYYLYLKACGETDIRYGFVKEGVKACGCGADLASTFVWNILFKKVEQEYYVIRVYRIRYEDGSFGIFTSSLQSVSDFEKSFRPYEFQGLVAVKRTDILKKYNPLEMGWQMYASEELTQREQYFTELINNPEQIVPVEKG